MKTNKSDKQRAAASIKNVLTTLEFQYLTPKEYQLCEKFYVLGLRRGRQSQANPDGNAK